MPTSRWNLFRQLYSCSAAFFFLLTLAVPCWPQTAEPVRTGMPYDWSHHHVIFSNSPSAKNMAAARADIRYWQQQVRMSAPSVPRPAWAQDQDQAQDSAAVTQKKKRADWSVTLGGTGSVIAADMYPAKYSFQVDAAPDCINDYVVFALNVTGSSSQATIVAYNNLYTDPAGTGYCAGTGPTVKWAYNTGGAISTSPTLSIGGMKVAWVANSNPPVLHVLTIGTTGSNGTSVSSPAVAGTGNDAVDKQVSYGSIGDTRSSPFVDYTGDAAYVASDDGIIHKFSGIFRGTPAEVTTGWPLHVIDSGNRKIAGPVFDSVSRNLFWGDDLGTFSYFREVGSTVGTCISQPVPPCWGQSTYDLTSNTYPILESPIVDSSLQKVYVFIGNDDQGLGHAHVLQTDTQLSSFAPEPPVGEAGQNMFAGAFDHNYYLSPATGYLYVCGYPSTGSASPVLYRIGFNSAGKMNTSHDANSLALGTATATTRCSPMTEFYNTTAAKDWLFAGMEAACTATSGSACIMSFSITSGFPTAVSNAVQEVGGTSGIVVDNVSSLPQASSIYFSTLNVTTCGDGNSGGGCAVKLTQAGLN